ncbi:MAG: ATP-binding protein, partial [Proteobacteria bacterium]|nr:ATP-binding protein [Pseudomonadota bacterium]
MLHLHTDTADLARLHPWLDRAATARALPQTMLHGMHVAIEEAVANVALHAFGPDQPGDIAVRLCAAPGVAALVVEDGGRPFDPAA